MTVLLAALIPVAAAAGWWACTRWKCRECDEWHYKRIETPALKGPPDPNLRIASLAYKERRVQVRVDARTRELREAVGDLLDTVATVYRPHDVDAIAAALNAAHGKETDQ